ncbi:MAG: ATP-binding protein, partial [Pseudomonadales bacterium]
MDPATGDISTYRHDDSDPNSLGADGVMTVFEDHQGNLWIGTYGGGVSLFDRETETFRRYDHDPNDPTSLSDSRASAILQDTEGAIWIGTFGGGLNRLNPGTETFQHFQHNPDDPHSLSDNTLYALHLDNNGSIWVGTAGGGLDRLVESSTRPAGFQFDNVSQQDGLPSNVIYSVQSDATNRLWLTTNYGLVRFDPSDSSIKTFHRSHGLQGEEFNYGAHHQAANGNLYFGGANGFNAFHPEDLEEASYTPGVVLTSYQKFNQAVATEVPYDLLQKIELGYQDDVVTFEFAALDFTAPLQNKYSYSLEGFDKGWIDLGTLRRVTYTNLASGEYVFRVKAATSDGIWTESGLSIPVIVASAPWLTGWAYSVYVAVALMLLWLAWRLHRSKLGREAAYSRRLEFDVAQRTEQLEERNQELRIASRAKSEFLARMSHEIRTPMNGMLGMTQLLMGTALDDKQHRFAQTIKRSADSLLEIVNDILDFSKIEAGRLELDRVKFDVSDLVEETVELFSASACEKDLELMCSTPAGATVAAIGDPLRLRQIIVNLLGNAIKFTRDGEVLLSYTITEDDPQKLCLRFEITDTGVGIKQHNQAVIFDSFSQEDGSTTRRFGGTGLGLAICKQLVDMMGGEIGVDSVASEGSSFWFTLVLDRAASSCATKSVSPRLANLSVL